MPSKITILPRRGYDPADPLAARLTPLERAQIQAELSRTGETLEETVARVLTESRAAVRAELAAAEKALSNPAKPRLEVIK